MTTDKKTSSVVQLQLPDHIQEQYPNFTEFLEAYYEWTEQNKQTTSVLKNLLKDQDIRTTSTGSAILTLGAGSGTFLVGEKVWQGALTISDALAKATVLAVNSDSIEVTDIVGAFNTGFGLVNGIDSLASYSITEIDYLAGSINDFIKWFRVEFIPSIPKEILANPKLMVEQARQFYKAKGTQKSYRLLFQILYNEKIEFYYPWTDLLRPSDSKWIQPRTLRVTAQFGNPFDLKSRTIRGQDSLSGALVEDVVTFTVGFTTVYELFLNRLSITGNFIPNELVSTEEDSEVDVTVQISPIVERIEISDPGEGYVVGDLITFNSYGTGEGALAEVTSVGTLGEILNVQMINFGANYDPAVIPFPEFPITSNLATAQVFIGALTEYPGYFLNDDGMLNSTNYIQDGHFYQQFSYVIKVNQSINQYRDIVKKLLHPAGLVFFGEMLSTTIIDTTSALSDSSPCAWVDIVRQQFNTPNYFPELGEFEGQQLPLYNNELGIANDASYVAITQSFEGDTLAVGPQLGSFDYLHPQHIPYPGSELSPDLDMGDPGHNASYWNEWANYQYTNFEDITYEDLVERPEKVINILPEPRIKTSS